MKTAAHLRHLRIAPRKVRLVADLVRGKKVGEAQAILRFTRKRAADSILKLLNSAVANAKNRGEQGTDASWRISHMTVDEGPKLKRFLPRARGRATPMLKRTSHVHLELDTESRDDKVTQ
ncbi:50S ribosomal protein L22 [Patescibacteria group bacterium]|nr:50S ribosomal protein L22 [Patescibacteria group bacterium]